MHSNRPKYPLRPLWLSLPMQQILFNAVETDHFEKYMLNIVELGYNAVILGGMESEVEPPLAEYRKQIAAIGPAITRNSIKCIMLLRPSQQSFAEQWINIYPFAHAVLWISHSIQSGDGQKTMSDRLQEEIRETERILGNRISLVFYLPFSDNVRGWRNSRLLTDLCLAAGKGTTLSFPAVAGFPWHDHLPLHPFLRQLRMQKEQHSTPLLPVINAGSLGQGEGLWPSICFDLFEYQYMQELSSQCTGFISLASRFPEKGEFLACNLWVAGQLQCQHASPDTLIDAWFRSNHPNSDYGKLKSIFKLIRHSVVELSFMRHLPENTSYAAEDKRLLLEYLLATFKAISLKADKDLQPQIQRYLSDAKEILQTSFIV